MSSELGEYDLMQHALEQSLSASFTGHTFATVWNELGGRATSKSADILFIITNLLRLNSAQLLDCVDSSNMLEAIILSLTNVPLSLLFQTSRDGGSNSATINSWIPRTVGPELLRTDVSLVLQRSHLSLEYQPGNQGLKVFLVHSRTDLPAGT